MIGGRASTLTLAKNSLISSTDFDRRHVINSFDVEALQFIYEPYLKANSTPSCRDFTAQSVVVVPLYTNVYSKTKQSNKK